MQFHLNYKPKASSFKIDHQQKVALIGSCFAEEIGTKLEKFHFNTLVNPNGILFNPKSIYQSILFCIENIDDINSYLLERNGIHLSFLHHSSISNVDKDTLRNELLNEQRKSRTFIIEANVLILTFGTAYSYVHKQHNITVANCHKQPADTFEKNLLSVSEIVSDYTELIGKLQLLNPDLKIIFTVSPVKYLKDGIEENNFSKATLLLSINELKKKFDIGYFPSYELVNDDLRDYRFYKEDMAHPNEEAIKYVWERFSDTYFTEETKKLNLELQHINTSEDHKILFPESEEAKLFKENLNTKKKELSKKHPFLKF